MQWSLRCQWWRYCFRASNFQHIPWALSSSSINSEALAYCFLPWAQPQWHCTSFTSILLYIAYLSSFSLLSLRNCRFGSLFFLQAIDFSRLPNHVFIAIVFSNDLLTPIKSLCSTTVYICPLSSSSFIFCICLSRFSKFLFILFYFGYLPSKYPILFDIFLTVISYRFLSSIDIFPNHALCFKSTQCTLAWFGWLNLLSETAVPSVSWFKVPYFQQWFATAAPIWWVTWYVIAWTMLKSGHCAFAAKFRLTTAEEWCFTASFSRKGGHLVGSWWFEFN